MIIHNNEDIVLSRCEMDAFRKQWANKLTVYLALNIHIV